MNKHIILLLSIFFIDIISCKKKKVDPVPINENVLFENIAPCSKSIKWEKDYPIIKSITSDTLKLKNVKGKYYLGYIGGLEFDNNQISPAIFPTWGKGHVFSPCNTPPSSLTKLYSYEIEFDCIFYQWDLGNRPIDFWPIAFTKLKILSKTEVPKSQ